MGLLSFFGSAAGKTIAGIGSSLLSNIFGASSTNNTNRTNLKINQMNNEFNERMMQKQMDYNTLMWNKQNAYNDPSAQRARMEEAGFNPFLAQGMNVGNASAVGGTSAATASPAAPQQAFRPDFSGIPQAILMARQGEKLEAETFQQVTDNQTRQLRNMQEIADLIAQTKGKEISNKLQLTMLKYADQVQMSQLQQMEAQTQNIMREGLLLDKSLSIFDEQTRLDFAQRAANIVLTESQNRKTEREIAHEVEKMIETRARTTGIHISNDVARRTATSLVTKAMHDAQRAGEPQNIWQGMSDAKSGFDKFVEKNIVKPTKKAWKDTKRSFGL